MKRKGLSLILVSVLVSLLIPAPSLAKAGKATENNSAQETSGAGEIILVKNVLDSQYDDIVDTNHAFLKEHLVDNILDFSGIVKELKSKKNYTIIGTYNQNLKNNTYSYKELTDKIIDIVYDNCCTTFSDYKKDTLASTLQKEFGESLEPGNQRTVTMLFAAQNKKTGLFISFVPVTIKIKAERGKTKTSAEVYSAEINSLNYVMLGGGL